MYKLITKLHTPPISVGAGAVYPMKQSIIDACERKAKYADADGNFEFSLCRVVGPEFHKRVLVPRNMAPSITEDLRHAGLDYKFESAFVPRNAEQNRCINEVAALLSKGKNFVFEAPTGFGKTWCATDIIAKVGKKTIIVVTKEDILDQWVVAIEKVLGLTRKNGLGIIKGDVCDTVNCGVVIAMVQSLAKEARYPEHIFRDFGLAIWDECHRIGADFFSQSCYRLPALLRLGISATPDRKDGREEVIEAHIGPTLVRTTIAPMVPRVISQDSPWKIPLVRKTDKQGKLVMGDDGKIEMSQMPHTAGRCGHVVRLLSNFHPRNKMLVNFVAQSYKAGRKILVQSDRKEHLEVLASMIASSGVPLTKITFYVGGLTSAQREKAKEGAVVMATYQMTAEATDIPELDTLVMASPKSDVRQIVGRIIRFVEGKKEPVVFDVRDDSSSVFEGYSNTRARWYASIGAKVQHLPVPLTNS